MAAPRGRPGRVRDHGDEALVAVAGAAATVREAGFMAQDVWYDAPGAPPQDARRRPGRAARGQARRALRRPGRRPRPPGVGAHARPAQLHVDRRTVAGVQELDRTTDARVQAEAEVADLRAQLAELRAAVLGAAA